MAYAALLSLSRTLDNILLSRDKSLILDEELQIKSLHEKLGIFISFLEQSSQKNSDSIEDLEERIRDAVYEAEDVIESHMSKQILSRYGCSAVRSCFWNYVTCLASRCKILEKKNYQGLQNIMEKLDSIWGDVEKIKDKEDIEDLQIMDPLTGPVKLESTSEIEELENMQSRISSSSKSASRDRNGPVVGIENNTVQIKELLTGSSSHLETISLVGMGGIGKTTLAQCIYNDSFVKRHFDVRAWIVVSQDYKVVALLADLLRSMGVDIDKKNETDMQELKQTLYQSLKERRYLIVMDDVWDTEFLTEFKNVLPDDNIGSRIIMTSRSSKVANFQNYSSHIHLVNFLSPEQSWNLLRRKTLEEETCSPGLEEIGRKIAEKCKGLPLSLVVIGGVLCKGKKTLARWKYVEENMKPAKAGNYDELMEVLSWSYNHLPHQIKACFLYMAVYPEEYVIHVCHLIKLWLAEGFIKPVPNQNLEQVAKEYLEDLASRSLIMVRNRTYCGEIKTFTIHDLIRDLCTRKSREKMFLQVVDNDDQEAIENERFVSIRRKKRFYFRHRHRPTVRSLLCFKRAFGYRFPRNIPLRLLRVLDACNIKFDIFPNEILNLVNLRYLAIRFRGGKIPPTISKLCNLQTLIVMYGGTDLDSGGMYLVSEILKMPSLRHLVVLGDNIFSYFPCDATMGNLQQLSGLTNIRFTKETIETIPDLKTLGIVYSYYRRINWSFYCLDNLVHLHELENLKLKFTGDPMIWQPMIWHPVSLSFPPKLKKLTLNGCKISWKQMSMIGSLPNLQVLKLKCIRFENSVWETNEEEFLHLKFLHIDIFLLEHWKAEATHFPSLECLSIRYCSFLKCIPPGIGEIPTLRDIVLYKCPSSVVDSAHEMLEKQCEFNESLQLHERSKLFGIRFFQNFEW